LLFAGQFEAVFIGNIQVSNLIKIKPFFNTMTQFLVTKEILKKYKAYVSNVEWHIRTNKPEAAEAERLKQRIDDWNEVIADLNAPSPSLDLEPVQASQDVEKLVNDWQATFKEWYNAQPFGPPTVKSIVDWFAALVEMHNTAKGRMKWVKASERLPNGKADIYHVKYNGQRDAIYFNPGDPESIGYWLDLDCEWLDEPRTPHPLKSKIN
jgi:hypothetical protein